MLLPNFLALLESTPKPTLSRPSLTYPLDYFVGGFILIMERFQQALCSSCVDIDISMLSSSNAPSAFIPINPPRTL
jgi:hypothetical protein